MFERIRERMANTKTSACSETQKNDSGHWIEHTSKLPVELLGRKEGAFLRKKGYSFFEDDREYYISIPQNGVVEVSSWCGDDGPDEDGFGREEYYDWWLLNEELKPIPGIPMRHAYSRLDMRNNEEAWNELKEKAAEAVKAK